MGVWPELIGCHQSPALGRLVRWALDPSFFSMYDASMERLNYHLSVPYRYDLPMDSHIVIEHASRDDLGFLIQSDSHIRDMEAKVFRREVLVARLNGSPVGWLRFNCFWDTIPFMNMLFVLAPHRGQSIGTRLVKFWEAEMLSLGYHEVLTSTQANETAQHFYRKLGYIDVGGFLLPSEHDEELLLHKTLG